MTVSFADIDALAAWAKEHGDTLRAEAVRNAPRVRALMVESLAKHPLLARYVRHLDARARNTQPWHALGERLYAALMLTQIGAEPSIVWRHFPGYPDPDDEQGIGLAMMVMQAVPYLWTVEIEDHVRAAPDLPRHVLSRESMPYPLMFFSYEVAYGRMGEEPTNDWMLLRHTAEGLELVGPWMDPPGPDRKLRFALGGFRYGTVYPTDVPPAAREGIGVVLRRLAFINSPYVSVAEHRLPRPMRREIVRSGAVPKAGHDPVCHVVTLRRPAADAHPRADDAETREWKHHWWVSGHFRAQWRPSTKDHELIWIAPHLKGPLEKPLLEKVYAVAR